MKAQSLLSGPDPRAGAESHAGHARRLGPLPPLDGGFIAALERSDLRGRGGAAFPVATKWRAVASRHSARPAILVNGAEGEPYSRKDRLLMESRPHLVLDGAAVAAGVLGAVEVVHYIGAEHRSALASMRAALAERPAHERRMSRIASAAVRYVAGEESAAVHFVNDGVALPVAVPPRPYERGVHGRPTLVQNVETLAHVAMIARYGDDWFRALGRGGRSGSVLLTVSGAAAGLSVVEVAQGCTLGDAVDAAGGPTERAGAVLLGGYFGSWLRAEDAWATVIDATSLAGRGLTLGCGVIGVLPARSCGVLSTARVVSYLAQESARQCGPCEFGLAAIAAATQRLAASRPDPGDLERLRRWAGMISGRGACHHPDGVARLLQSALTVFEHEFGSHARGQRCAAAGMLALSA